MKIYTWMIFCTLSFVNNEGRFLHKKHLHKSAKEKTRHPTRWKFNNSISEKLHIKQKSRVLEKDVKLRAMKNDHVVEKRKGKKGLSRGGRKSLIKENLAPSPVIYNSPNGHDYYVYVKTKSPQQTVQHTAPVVAQPLSLVAINTTRPPSRTFLVTVYGKDLDGVEEKIREALADPPKTTARPCNCPCCQCACQSPGLLKNADCSCDKTSNCPCDGDNSNASPVMMFFPMSGAPMQQQNAHCSCPCCMCSCMNPNYENYNCGCQNTPPVPCPCGGASVAMTNPTSSPSCQCPASSGTSCACPSPTPTNNYCACANQPGVPCPCANNYNPSNALQAKGNVASDHDVFPTTATSAQAHRVGPYDIQSACDCYCCPCTCPVTFSSENPPCMCKPETQSSCPCKRSHVHFK